MWVTGTPKTRAPGGLGWRWTLTREKAPHEEATLFRGAGGRRAAPGGSRCPGGRSPSSRDPPADILPPELVVRRDTPRQRMGAPPQSSLAKASMALADEIGGPSDGEMMMWFVVGTSHLIENDNVGDLPQRCRGTPHPTTHRPPMQPAGGDSELARLRTLAPSLYPRSIRPPRASTRQ